MKLYRVILRGMTDNVVCAPAGDCFVLADDTEQAYRIVRDRCEEKGYGFEQDRELKYVELVADPLGECGMYLLQRREEKE